MNEVRAIRILQARKTAQSDSEELVSYALSIEDSPSADDLKAIERGLDEYNSAFAPAGSHVPLSALLRVESHGVIGGLVGTTFWGWLRIDVLWLQETVRGKGCGSRLLKTAEDEALRRGCHHAFLDTLSFQALPFYLKHGYRVLESFTIFPRGIRTILFRSR